MFSEQYWEQGNAGINKERNDLCIAGQQNIILVHETASLKLIFGKFRYGVHVLLSILLYLFFKKNNKGLLLFL